MSTRSIKLKEAQRRAQLYGTCNIKSLPKTKKMSKDRRIVLPDSNNNERETRKQRVPVVKRNTTPAWKMGFCATPSSYKASAMGIGGLLEPSEGVKSRMLDEPQYARVSKAYPPQRRDFLEKTILTPQAWQASNTLHLRPSSSNSSSIWSPSKSPVKGYEGDFDFKGFERRRRPATASSSIRRQNKTKSARPKSAAVITNKPLRQQSAMYDINGRRKSRASQPFPLRRRRQETEESKLDPRYSEKKEAEIERVER